ncbi:hypothetical protein Lalb_Chr02g0146601 [Lupinus albus]|uniref:Uncharacterized protein n=1 Tax=Lupinus albus TaxID=3870 RepID=A0A6A4QXE5_LUPAL|nr:hypothetical protein Lalb_Chr02g0146601 [Lupinus albus]
MHHIFEYQSSPRCKPQLHITSSSNSSGVRVSQQHFLVISIRVCFEHSTIIADMAGCTSIYPPPITSSNHCDFS